MPQVSAELRWFLDATHRTEVEAFTQWFQGGPMRPGGGVERIDVYVLDPSTDELGAKLRDMNTADLELKALVVPALCSLSLGTRTAAVQVWSKVISKAVALPEPASARRSTRKRRWLRTFDTSGPEPQEVELGGGESREGPVNGSRPATGCNVEWTAVTVDGRTWWTFGLEAFSSGTTGSVEARLEDGLRRALVALEHSLGRMPVLGTSWLEQSYPAWLRSF
jgi:hypothetical protein